MPIKQLFGASATLISLVSYAPYIKNILLGKTKPHVFTWFVWSILTAIGFFAQIYGGAGAGAWVSGVTSLLCFLIFLLSLIRGGIKQIVFVDWLSLTGAIVAITLWAITKNPLLSLMFVVVSDFFGYFPTIRKSIRKPFEETMSTYVLSAGKEVFAFFAMDTISPITIMYPVYLIVINVFFVSFVIVRRIQISKKK